MRPRRLFDSITDASEYWIARRSLSSGGHSADPLARNDVALIFQIRVHDLAAPCARAVDESSAQRGRGERRVPVAPAVSCAMIVVERTRVTTSTPESPGIPARNGFNGFLRALPGDRALLPPSLADMVLSDPVGSIKPPQT